MNVSSGLRPNALTRPRWPERIGEPARDFAAILAMLLVSRALLLAVGYAAAVHAGTPTEPLALLCRFDCGWYLGIAEHGYSVAEASNQPGATSFGFFPLFPLLVRSVSPLFAGNLLLAAVIAANGCVLAALIYVYRYALLIGASRFAALSGVALLCIFPQSIVFSAPYSESLFLLLLAAAVFHFLREQFLLAALAAALLSATRPTGVLFIVFALVCSLRSLGLRNMLLPWRQPDRFVPLVFAPLGMFLFWGYCLFAVDDAFAHAHTELHGWGYYFMAPWSGLRVLLKLPGIPLIATLCSFAVLACALLLIQRRRYAEFALCLAFVLLMWSTSTIGSIFRYWLVLFPIWVEVARRLEARPFVFATVFSALAIVNGCMMWAWTLGDASGI